MSIYTVAGGFLLLTNLWAITRTLRSDAEAAAKWRWVAMVLLLPVIGAVAWILYGPS